MAAAVSLAAVIEMGASVVLYVILIAPLFQNLKCKCAPVYDANTHGVIDITGRVGLLCYMSS